MAGKPVSIEMLCDEYPWYATTFRELWAIHCEGESIIHQKVERLSRFARRMRRTQQLRVDQLMSSDLLSGAA